MTITTANDKHKYGDGSIKNRISRAERPGLSEATHHLYREDFRDASHWTYLLEAHGITWKGEGPEPDEICIRSVVEFYGTE